ILNPRSPFEPNEIQRKSVVVITVNHRHIREQIIRENVIPSQVKKGIPELIGQSVFYVKNISPKITRQVQTVVVISFIADFRIQIIEISRILIVCKLQEQMSIRASSGYQERHFIFNDRPFKHQATRNEPNSSCSVEFFAVSFFLINIQNRRNSTSVSSRNSAFIQFQIFNRIRIKNGEKPKKVRGTIHRSFIKQNQILVCCSS